MFMELVMLVMLVMVLVLVFKMTIIMFYLNIITLMTKGRRNSRLQS